MASYENTTVGDLLDMDTEELLNAIGRGSSPIYDFLMDLVRKRELIRMGRVGDYPQIDYRGNRNMRTLSKNIFITIPKLLRKFIIQRCKSSRRTRNTIALLLQDWNLIDITDVARVENKAPLSQIKVLPFKEKNEWNLTAKYNIGKKIEGTDGGDAGTKV